MSEPTHADDALAAKLAAKSIVQALSADAAPQWSNEEAKEIDAWIKSQNDPAMDRREAVRRLVEIGLKAKNK